MYSDGRLSLAVQQRADAAIDLWRTGRVKKLLVSGDNRTIYYDEATTIKNYLLAQQVAVSDVFVDYA